MATGAVGNIIVNRVSKSLLVNGLNIVNDVAYVCPAGSYADVYFDFISRSGSMFSYISYLNAFINIVGSSNSFPEQVVETFYPTGNPNYSRINYKGGINYPSTQNQYLGTGAIENRISDKQLFSVTPTNGGTPTYSSVGCVFRLFAGDFVSLNYSATNVNGGAAYNFNLTAIEVQS